MNDRDDSGPARPQARLAKGLRDIQAPELRRLRRMTETLSSVFESYGFEPLETPAFEYSDALGKFLPDQDRPNAGVFSFQDEDEQWLSLRYDLTAPLARYVAENFERLPKPFRRYQTGPVWRNEKPGPGRFRQFVQFDADTVGAASVAADAELCMLAADALEALGIKRGDYVIKVSSRKVLDGVLDAAGVAPEQRLTVLRAIDKLDRLGVEGVRALLGPGREDESGDFTKGAGLGDEQIDRVLNRISSGVTGDIGGSPIGVMLTGQASEGHLPEGHAIELQGLEELSEIQMLVRAAGYERNRIRIDPSVVRGLEYYTGPVFEAELTFEVKDEDGRPMRFGSVGGGGRYDGLIERFTGQAVPATGFSIGVSRLMAALAALHPDGETAPQGPVVVLVLDRDRMADMQLLVQQLRDAGIRAEMYLGSSGMKAQMKYADRRGAPCVVIQGTDEKAKGEVTIKDLVAGAEAARGLSDNTQWREERPGQFSVPETDLVAAVRSVIARQGALS
jgi:histidyl-tRNA synthetase